jgi:hypothetical protein
MRESSTYQYILDEGRVEEAQKILLRLGRKKFGPPGEVVQSALSAITDLDRLERMTDQLLVVNTWQELLAPDRQR